MDRIENSRSASIHSSGPDEVPDAKKAKPKADSDRPTNTPPLGAYVASTRARNARPEHHQARVSKNAPQPRAETWTIEVGNDLADMRRGTIELLDKLGPISDNRRHELRLGLTELLANAVEHGNLEISSEQKTAALEDWTFDDLREERCRDPKFADRKVALRCARQGDRLTIAIRDQGPGFDVAKTREHEAGSDEEHGRGLSLVRQVFDEVAYNKKGNVVTVEFGLEAKA